MSEDFLDSYLVELRDRRELGPTGVVKYMCAENRPSDFRFIFWLSNAFGIPIPVLYDPLDYLNERKWDFESDEFDTEEFDAMFSAYWPTKTDNSK